MATLNEIAYDILSIMRPQGSDDSDLEISQIKFWIKNQRALLVRNEVNKNRTIDADILQTVCSDLEEVDSSICCGIELGCPILRTKTKIPKTVELHFKEAITRVGPVNIKGKPFSYISYDRVPWAANGRFNTKLIYAFLHDEYIYVYSKDPKYLSLKTISFRGIFEDPEEVRNFKDCDGVPCYSDDDPYPIKTWMLPAIKELILNGNLKLQSQAEYAQADVDNNAASNVKQIT